VRRTAILVTNLLVDWVCVAYTLWGQISANQRMTDCRGVSDRKHPHGVDVLAIGERGCITEEQNPIGYIYKCIVHKMAAAISVFLVHIAYGMDCVT